MRIGTWNLAGRWDARHLALIETMDCTAGSTARSCRPVARARPPRAVRAAWQPLIDHACDGRVEDTSEASFDDIQKSKREERQERIAARRAEPARRLAESD